MSLRERGVDAAYATGWAAVRGMPEWMARAQFDLIADAVWARGGRGVDRLEANLRQVLGPSASRAQVRQVTHRAVRSYLRYWCEVFQLPRMSRDQIVGRMSVRDEWRLRAAVDAGAGMILALPHMGNWDHAGAWLTATGVPFTTVAERLEPASLFERFVEFRESLGMEVLALTGGEQAPYAVLASRLRAGGALCLLADRDLTAAGVEVQFFGATAKMPAGPAALAIDTGAPLLPVTLSYPDRRRWAGRIHEQVHVPAAGTREEKVRAMTQQLADAFADGIAAAPHDWHMLQRVWVGT